MNYISKFIIILVFTYFSGYSQELLTKENAISLALENNYGIQIAKNNVKIAENNKSIYNSNYLPSVSVNAGGNYSNNDTDLTLQDGTKTENNGAESKTLNSSIGLNYLLFDGLGRSYNYKRLKEEYNLSELEAQLVIENSLLQIFTLYYDVALLTENNKNILESLNISKRRLERTKYAFEYGQNTKLQVLNAEVDVNNDSIRYINSQQILANSKRDLNLLLGRDVATDFTVETDVEFNSIFELQSLLEKAKTHNIQIQQANKNVELSNLDLKISKSNLYPEISLNSSYGFNKVDNDVGFNFTEQFSKGLNAGITLNWNVFDGGSTKTRIQNAKIVNNSLEIQKEQLLNELERNVANAIEIYNNALFILQSEEKNVETNKHNFSRTEEQFKLGQVTSIEFRQAQVNLLNAQSNLNQAKYDAKNTELKLLQLTGELLNSQF